MKKNIELIRQFGKIQLVTTLIIALFFMTTGFLILPNLVDAAALTDVKDVISVPLPATDSNHTFSFSLDAANTFATTETIVVTFPSGFDLTDLANSDALDYDIRTDTGGTPVDETIVVNGNCGATDAIEITTVSATAITFTACGSYLATPAGAGIEIEIGLNATTGGNGNSQIENKSKTAAVGTADTHQITIAAGGDTGTAMIAIIEGVTVSVSIDETLSVAVASTTDALCPATIPGTDKSDDASHDATNITFGTLSAGDAFYHSCHLVTVSTNADDGYTSTVEKTQVLTSGSNTIADGDCTSSSCSAILSGLWAGTSDNGFGYCLEDVTGNPAITTDSSDDIETGATDWTDISQCDDATPEFKTFPTTGGTPEPVMKSFNEVSGDQIRMGVVLNYSATAPAGDYTTVLRFITTPTF